MVQMPQLSHTSLGVLLAPGDLSKAADGRQLRSPGLGPDPLFHSAFSQKSRQVLMKGASVPERGWRIHFPLGS